MDCCSPSLGVKIWINRSQHRAYWSQLFSAPFAPFCLAGSLHKFATSDPKTDSSSRHLFEATRGLCASAARRGATPPATSASPAPPARGSGRWARRWSWASLGWPSRDSCGAGGPGGSRGGRKRFRFLVYFCAFLAVCVFVCEGARVVF